jgi:uncharacterized membrane protein
VDLSTSLFYNFGGYCAKLVHVFGAIIWLGGVLFMAGVATPILKYYQDPEHPDPRVGEVVGLLERRLLGFNSMALWSSFISGIAMLIFLPRMKWMHLESLYDWVIHLKVALFLPVIFINSLLNRSYRERESARSTLETGEDLSLLQIVEWRIVSLRRLNVYLAFLLIILVAML